MKELIYISFCPLTEKIRHDFFIDNLYHKGFSIKFLELSFIYKNKTVLSEKVNESFVYKISSLDTLKKILKESNSNAIIFVFMHLEHKTFKVYRLLSKLNLFTCFIATGQFQISKHKSQLRIIKEVIKKIGLNFAYSFRLIKQFDVVFVSGNKCKELYSCHKKTINYNYFDYDKYIEIKDLERFKDDQYIVFLDINLPYHSDQTILGIKPINPKLYFNEMNNFFEKIERIYNKKIVIATHPKSSYNKNPYNGRELFYGKTAELVKDCEFVLSHSSSSFSFAVLFNKPLCLLYSLQIKKIYGEVLMTPMENLVEQLNCKIVNMDEFHNYEIDCYVDVERYNKYKYDYLTSTESENQLSRDIMYNSLIKKNNII